MHYLAPLPANVYDLLGQTRTANRLAHALEEKGWHQLKIKKNFLNLRFFATLVWFQFLGIKP